jgi:uncharacterized short protein YbdD (DUF466 family)
MIYECAMDTLQVIHRLHMGYSDYHDHRKTKHPRQITIIIKTDYSFIINCQLSIVHGFLPFYFAKGLLFLQ